MRIARAEVAGAEPQIKVTRTEVSTARRPAVQIPVRRIGVARPGTNPPIFRDAAGRIIPLKSLSYSHF